MKLFGKKNPEEKRITVDYLARVEGETGLDVLIKEGKVAEVKLELFEPPRFFEAFLVGRKYYEAPEITSRICGICPHPHQLSAVQAVERALEVKVSEQTRDLRKLLHLGDWIQSHALHVYMLAAPDYLGYESVVAMAGNPELLPVVQRALRLKRLGNDISVAVGGREVHPITITVGGFTRLPEEAQLKALRERLVAAKEDAVETVRLAAKLPLPSFVRECEHVALHDSSQYAVNEGDLVSTRGLNVPNHAYREVLIERHVPHSNAKHAVIKDRDSFLVGPVARVNLNFEQLSPDAKAAARETGLQFPNFNPFVSAAARGIELVHAVDECIEIIDRLKLKPEEIKVRVKAGEGYAVTEAPRGICCHGYKINQDGLITWADVVAPTARNAYNMEKDLWEFVPAILNLPLEEATLKCEMLIRAYDPCFSCATHTLKLRLHKA